MVITRVFQGPHVSLTKAVRDRRNQMTQMAEKLILLCQPHNTGDTIMNIHSLNIPTYIFIEHGVKRLHVMSH